MPIPNAKGYLLAVALFLVCCWVNPNVAIPHRTRPQATEQQTLTFLYLEASNSPTARHGTSVDQRVGSRVERSTSNDTDREIGQPDLGADKKPALSGGGQKLRSSHRTRSSRSRIKNVNVNVNRNVGRVTKPPSRSVNMNKATGKLPKARPSHKRPSKIEEATESLPKVNEVAAAEGDNDLSKLHMMPLTTETINCSEPHNANDRYSSSFSGNVSMRALNVEGEDFQVAGEAGTKKTSSVHVGEDITLCWIETTTIKEDHSFDPVQRFVIREYTISFENSATIPERYLECVKLEGEVNGKNTSFPKSALFEVMDENTRHSRVVNFTTVSHSDDLIVWQHKRVRCGVGPVVTKNIIEWADDSSENPKKRVEIKVSPKIHRLSAHPTDVEPCTTDVMDSEPRPTAPITPPSSIECGPGTSCGTYSDCADEYCGDLNTTDGVTTSSYPKKETTESYATISTTEKQEYGSTHKIEDYESDELLSTGQTKVPPRVTNEMINSSDEITTPVPTTVKSSQEDDIFSFTTIPPRLTTTVHNKPWTIPSDFADSDSTETSSVMSVTLAHDQEKVVVAGNQEKEVPETAEDVNYSSTSESDDSCGSDESCARYSSESSIGSTEYSQSSERDTSGTEEFTAAPTVDASSTQSGDLTAEDTSEYLSLEEWDASSESTESEGNNRVTEATRSETTSAEIFQTLRSSSKSVSRCDPNLENCTESTTEVTTTHLVPEIVRSGNRQHSTEGLPTDTSTPMTITTAANISEKTGIMNDEPITLRGETTTEKIASGITDKFTELTTPKIESSGESTTAKTSTGIGANTEETVTESSGRTTEVTESSFTLSTEPDTKGNITATTEVTGLGSVTIPGGNTTSIDHTITGVTAPSSTSDTEITSEITTAGISSVKTTVTVSLGTTGGLNTTDQTLTGISNATTDMTTPLSTVGGETTTEEIGNSTSNTVTDMTVTLSSSSGVEITKLTTIGVSNPTTESIPGISHTVTKMSTPLDTSSGLTTTEGATTGINDSFTEISLPSSTLGSGKTTEETTTGISDTMTDMTTPLSTLGGLTTTEGTSTGISHIVTETTLASSTSAGEKITTDISHATTEITSEGEMTTEKSSTGISKVVTEMTQPISTISGETMTEETAIGISNAVTKMTPPSSTLGGKTTTEGITTDISDVMTKVTISSTTERYEPESTVLSTEGTTHTKDEVHPGGHTTSISDTTTERITKVTKSSTTEKYQPESTVLSTEETTQTTDEVHPGGHTTSISDTTTERITKVTESSTIEKYQPESTVLSTEETTQTTDEVHPGGHTTSISDTTTERITKVTKSSTTEKYQPESTVLSTGETTQTTDKLHPGGHTTSISDTTTERITKVTESSTTEKYQPESTVLSTEGTNQTTDEVYPGGHTTSISDTTTKSITYTNDTGIEGTTTVVPSTTVGKHEVKTSTETTLVSNPTDFTQYTHESTTVRGVTEIVFPTTHVNDHTSTHKVEGSSMGTTTETVAVTKNEETTTEHLNMSTSVPSSVTEHGKPTTEYSTTVSSTSARPTTGEPGCKNDTGDCETTQKVDVTPIPIKPCDPEVEDCGSEDESTSTSCDEDSDSCSFDSSSSSSMSCDEESADCSFDSSSSSGITCDEESGDCSGSVSMTCDEESAECSYESSSVSLARCEDGTNSPCTPPIETQRYATSADSPEICDNDSTENCTLISERRNETDLSPIVSFTPIPFENISTTVSNVPTTVGSRKSTTAKAASEDGKLNHKLGLRIKILLEHIDDNQRKQKLVEVEKHLLFNEQPNEHGKHSLMKQVRALNNTISMGTVQELFNCSAVEKLTGDIGAFAVKYLAMHDGLQREEGANNSESSGDLHVRKQRESSFTVDSSVNPNVEMSLPGIHDDIHSGLSHVMSHVSSKHVVKRRSVELPEKKISHSRILEVVADPQDRRVHSRRKRETIEDLTIDEEDMPQDIEEVGHWSNERVRRAVNGGRVRTLTKFTIYK